MVDHQLTGLSAAAQPSRGVTTCGRVRAVGCRVSARGVRDARAPARLHATRRGFAHHSVVMLPDRAGEEEGFADQGRHSEADDGNRTRILSLGNGSTPAGPAHSRRQRVLCVAALGRCSGLVVGTPTPLFDNQPRTTSCERGVQCRLSDACEDALSFVVGSLSPGAWLLPWLLGWRLRGPTPRGSAGSWSGH